MMRALWTAAAGMTAQQFQVDTISNNMANVDTLGFKQENVSFKSLLYQTIEQPVNANPISPMQVGHGVRVGSVTRAFDQGILTTTGDVLDLAIEGEGFFALSDPSYSTEDQEGIIYTRDGSFKLANTQGTGYALVSSNAKPVLSVGGEAIVFDLDINTTTLSIDKDGIISWTNEAGVIEELDQLMVVQFPNTPGLEAVGENAYIPTGASGEPLLESEDESLIQSKIQSGVLEESNVNIATAMVDLIVAQRAYEMNSTAIKTADTMLQQANELKRV
ncbi:hypothetical protein AN644_01660 [Candidatus Epulonipiscium fishelsonii]|nr:hypothetical protein AN644_01660 [Epulopiscium sp. SCG-C06WGA-EpuloA1]